MTLSGGSRLEGRIEAGDITVHVSGGSVLALSGAAGKATIEASGGSEASPGDLHVADAHINASGESRVTVKPAGRLDADASGGSDIYYVGAPTMGSIDMSGGGSVKGK